MVMNKAVRFLAWGGGLSLVEQVEVLKPDSLRQKIWDKIGKMAELYEV